MKKFGKSLILLCALALATALCFAACGPKEEPHTHTFDTTQWVKGETTHWHPATCGHDEEKGDEAPHTYVDGVCSTCGKPDPAQHEHSFNTDAWVNTDPDTHWHPATCDHTDEKGDEAPHVWTDVPGTDTATCTATGTKQQRCGVCGATKTVESEMKEHEFTVDVPAKPATCTEPGYNAHKKCAHCEATEGKVVEPAKNHEFTVDVPAKAATCGEDGYNAHKKCSRCEETQGKEIEPATGEHGAMTDEGKCSVCEQNLLTDEYLNARYEFANSGSGVAIVGLKEGFAALADKVTVIPSKYSGKSVVAIGDYAFESATLERVVIPSGVLVEEGAFRFSTVKSLVLNNSRLNDEAFYGCESLASVKFGNSVSRIGPKAFARCTALSQAVELKALTYLGQRAFAGSAITSVDVKCGADARIATQAFAECASLAEATISGINYHFGQLFAECGALETLTIPFVGSNVSYSDAAVRAFGYLFGTVEPTEATKFDAAEQDGVTYYIPKSLTSVHVTGGTIAVGAFDNCVSLTTITVESGVSLNATKFENCPAKIDGEAIPGPALTVTPDNSVIFIGEDVTLTVETDAGATIAYAVKKGGAAASAGTDYELDEAQKKFTFKTKGEYTIEVTATKDGHPSVKTVTVTVKDPNEGLSVTLSAEPTETTTGIDVELTPSVTAADGDSAETTTYTVKKDGGDASADTDYTLTGNKIKFLQPGSYGIVCHVETEKGGRADSAEVTITVSAPEISLTVTADKSEIFKGESVTLTVNTVEEATLTYAVKKDGGEATAETDYEIAEAEKKITFKTVGTFTVTVTAEKSGAHADYDVTVTVKDPNNFEPTLEASSKGALVEEAKEITLTAAANVCEGDEVRTETYTVTEKKDADYADADAGHYEWVEEHTKIKFTVAGEYRIRYTVETQKGGTASVEIDIVILASKLTFALTAETKNDWVRAQTDTDTEVTYTVDGNVEAFDVTYGADVEGVTAKAGEGTSVSINSSVVTTATVTVTYTHKVATDLTFSLDIPVSFVDDIANSPILGSDPFGGTYGKLIPSTGLILYYDVTDKDGEAQLAATEVTYTLESKALEEDRNVTIGKINNMADQQFVLVEAWGNNNVARGTVTIKLTATKDGHSAVAFKTFEVYTLDDPATPVGMNEYAKAVMGDKFGDMDLDSIISGQMRENGVLGKDGFIVHRTSDNGWDPYPGNIFVVKVENVDNFQVDFDYTVLARTRDNKKASFAVNMRTGGWNNYHGSQVAFYVEGNSNAITAGFWGNEDVDGKPVDGIHWCEEQDKPQVELGELIHVRFTHTVKDGAAHFLWQWSKDNAEWKDWISYAYTVQTEAGKMGAPINAMQFNTEQGTYRIGNVKLTKNIEVA